MSKNVTTFDIVIKNLPILSKAKARELKSLDTKKERDKKGLFLVEGEKGFRDLIKYFTPEYVLCTAKWLETNQDIKEKFTDKVLISDYTSLSIVSSHKSVPEVIAVFRKPDTHDVPELRDDKFYLLLDEIQDPGNLGTIIRTCDWFGIYEIFASPNTADVFSPKVVQSTMGSLGRVRVYYIELSGLIEKYKNFNIIGTTLEGEPLSRIENLKAGLIIMGNEGRGISDSIKEKLNLSVTIPPVNVDNHPDSLNVAIATGIILSHFTEQL